MRLNIIRVIVEGKVSDDGRRPDTVMGYFSPVFQSTEATDLLVCCQVPSGVNRVIC